MPFRDIVGHAPVLALVSRAIARGTLPPSLLLVGPDGVGKRTTAVAVAQALNCETPIRDVALPHGHRAEIDACGTCGACRRIARGEERLRAGEGAALDTFRVLAPDEKGSIKVDPVRDLVAAAGFRPLDGQRRVIVIDGAEALETGAQNALLKTLEEPPPGTVLLLIAARVDALLATVRSRCPELRFAPLAEREVAGLLAARCGLDPAEANAAAGVSGGSLTVALARRPGAVADAREIAHDVLAGLARGGPDDVRLDVASRLLVRAAPRTMAARGRGAAGKAGGRGAAAAAGGAGRKGAQADRQQVAARLDAMASLLRDLQVVGSGADRRWLANADLEASLTALRSAYDGPRIGRAFEAVDRARIALDRNVSPKAVAAWLAFNL
ncbi:MAG: AAA family ATPase [Vicinamibacteraceae bacterium]|nr:AAA family ATPase [Vicinamibacteraceae bacterium]